jgi:hypothetical protein
VTSQSQTALLVRVDRYAWYGFIIWFALALFLNMTEQPAGHTVAFGGILLLLALNFARLIIVAEHFKAPGKGGFRLLAYLLIVVLAGAITISLLMRGAR